MFAFKCPKGHRLEADCTREEAALLDGKDCIVPGCGLKLDRDLSSIGFVSSAEGSGGKLDKIRRENRERTAEARRLAAEENRINPQRMTELDYLPSGEGDRSRFGGDRIRIPTSVIDSIKEKAKEALPTPEDI